MIFTGLHDDITTNTNELMFVFLSTSVFVTRGAATTTAAIITDSSFPTFLPAQNRVKLFDPNIIRNTI